MSLSTLRRAAGIFFFILSLSVSASVAAQNQLYTVQVGLFQDVSLDDFESLNNLGFIYAQEVESNVHQVYIGNFSNQARAQAVVDRLQERNFRNATILTQPLSAGSDIAVIQLTTQTLGTELDWPTLQQAGSLYVQSDDQLLKVMTGVYRNRAHAQSDLQRIRDLGFRDAFVKEINNYRLVPITDWETGIRDPLIPIQINTAPPTAQNETPTTSGPGTYSGEVSIGSSTGGTLTPRTGTNAANLPAAAVANGLPTIRSNMRRESATELQRVLKANGYYQGALDGYYGPGTTSAYRAAWNAMPGITKYRRLSADAGTADFMAWPEARVLHTIATDLGAGQINQQLATTGANDRARYYAASQPVTAATATRAQAWHLTLWERLDNWSNSDPLLDQAVAALRVAYHQTQVRAEDYFMTKGFNGEQAKNLALVSLQAMVGAELQRFL